MAMSRVEWIGMELRCRLQGRAGMERSIRERHRRWYGVPPAEPPHERLTDLVFARMLQANRARDTSLAPYTDKYAVRAYVARTVGDDALVPLAWTGRNPWRIPLDPALLPAVLKGNHMSQAVLVVTAETDPTLMRRKALRWLMDNYYYTGGEYQYRAIRPRLLLEQFLDDGTEFGPRDYSFWCVHGVPLLIQVRDGSHELRQAYDLRWNPLPALQPGTRSLVVEAPGALEEMTAMAARLSAPFPFVRVDLYDVHGHPYFGELTFTPAGGRLRLASDEIDRFLGRLLQASPGAVRASTDAVRSELASLAREAEAARPV